MVICFWKLDVWLRSIDTSPADEDPRTPGLPLDRQIRIGTGIQYDWNKAVTEEPPMNIWMRAKQRSIKMAGPSRALSRVNTVPT